MGRLGSERGIYVLLIATMAIWGINLSAVKVLTASLDVLTVASVRMVVAALVLSVLLLVLRQPFPSLMGRQGLALAACSVVMVYGNQIFFAGGLSKTSATHAALIMALSPLASTLLAAKLLGEKIRGRRLAGILVGFTGVACVILNRPPGVVESSLIGDALMFGAMGCFATGGIAVQRLSMRLTALQIGWAVHVFGASLLAAHTVLSPNFHVESLLDASGKTWLLIAYSGVLATGLSAILWNLAISRLGAARTALSFYWVPIFGVIFAVAFLGESLTWWHAMGLLGVILGSRLGTARPA